MFLPYRRTLSQRQGCRCNPAVLLAQKPLCHVALTVIHLGHRRRVTSHGHDPVMLRRHRLRRSRQRQRGQQDRQQRGGKTELCAMPKQAFAAQAGVCENNIYTIITPLLSFAKTNQQGTSHVQA